MAEVFSGFVIGSHGFQKPVAIKRLLPELANDHVFVERLIGEAKLLVGMQHGNIVSVLDLARDGDDVFLVMEFVDGPSLRQLMKARGKRLLSMGVASYVVQGAAQGLHFAHVRPGGAIIHADISPSNLLLTTSGEVRVADFGIARREGGLVGVVEGKWAYMAPEQARGENLSARSDVFALGVVLYELITGQHPLGRQVSAEERDSGPIRVIPPRVVNPAVPPGLDAICMKALSENARDRYPSMQAFSDAIMDERFTNQWREGANDLAIAIREITPGVVAAPAVGPRTQVTDRPVTIVTRSLISQPQRMSSPQMMPEPPSRMARSSSQIAYESPSRSQLAYESPSKSRSQSTPTAAPDEETLDEHPREVHAVVPPPSGAQTMLLEMAAMLPPPIDGRMSSSMIAPELASVHGGSTVTGSHLVDLRDARSGNRWTAVVLGIAAVLGIGAAVAIQLAPSDKVARATAAVESEEVAAAAGPETPAIETSRAPAIETAIAPVPTVPAVIEQPAALVADEQPIVTAPKKAKARTAPTPTKRSGGAEAMLRVTTYNAVWAWVYIGSQRQEVPDAKFKLAPGTYTVRLKNTDLNVTRTCSVTLEAGQVRSLKVEMEEGGCDLAR
jgi:serine/threonine-protein kinase